MTILEPDQEWFTILGSAYNELLAHAGLPFSEMTPAMVTEDPGVYLITAKEGHAEKGAPAHNLFYVNR